MTSIGGGYKGLVAEPTDYHSFHFVDGRIWLFNLKYFEQPTYNWGHRVAFQGGYSLSFDPSNQKWSGPFEYPALNQDENCEEILFVRKNSLYIFLYRDHEQFEPIGLYKWDTEKHEWNGETISMSGSSIAEKYDRNELIPIDDLPNANDFHFFLNQEHSSIYRIDLESGHISRRCKIEAEEMDSMRGRPIHGSKKGDDVYLFYAVMGCNYRWEKERPIKIDLSSGKGVLAGINNDSSPRFSYTGARLTSIRPNGQWLHATGSIQVGMCGSEFNGELTSLDLDSNPLNWISQSQKVTEEKGLAYDYSSDTVYAIGENAVEKLSL